jgi:hypothetical protein
MARIRSVKPEFWTDGTIVQLSIPARLFYIGTWNFSLCDRGHLPDDALGLKLKIFPADDVDAASILAELLKAGRLTRRRSADGRTYLFNPRLGEHQKTDARWNSRCPHCTSEESGGFTEDVVSLPEPRPTSPELPDPPPASAQEGYRRGGVGIGGDGDQHASRAVASRSSSTAPLSITQRSKKITDAYTAAEPMSKWPAVNGVVIKAIKAERWSDEEIHAALLRMAAEKRPVTVDSLRVELDGLPSRASPTGLVEQNGLRLKPETAARLNDRARLEAMDAANGHTAIGGS